jgi:hypothetical protein
MTTSNGVKGLERAAFVPDPAGVNPASTNPAYTTPDAVVLAYVDPYGNLNARAQVLTDEGGFRDDFAGGALDPAWTAVPGAGGAISVGSSLLSIASGTAANDLVYVVRNADFLPLSLAFFIAAVTGRAAATAGVDFFMGLYNDMNPSLATEFVEWALFGGGANTDGVFTSRAHAGAGGASGPTTFTIQNTLTLPGWRTMSLDGEQVILRDGTTTTGTTAWPLPAPTVRYNAGRHLPGLYTSLFCAIGFRLPAAPVTGFSVDLDAVFLKNFNRPVVNTTF